MTGRRDRQRGAALVLGLLFLFLLSGVVTAAFSDNQWQLRIASHELAEERAMQSARSALAWAEDWVLAQPGDQRPVPCPGQCGPSDPVLGAGLAPATPERRPETWWLGHAYADGFDPVAGASVVRRQRANTPPGRWIVEEVHFEPGDAHDPARPAVSYYRLVARAARAPRGEAVVLESIVARPWGEPAWSDDLPGGGPGFCNGVNAPDPCGRLAWRRRQ